MEIRFDGKRALVTGAGKGIGRTVAMALWKAGAEVVAVSRTQERLSSLLSECPGMQTICLDISDWDPTRSAIQDVGEIDLLVNNAGVVGTAPFLEATKEDFDWMMNTNLRAVFNISQVLAKKMVAREAGGKGCAIVNISSISSKTALPGHSVYAPLKAALDHLTRCMALELGPHQIRVNVVSPSVTLTPLGREIWLDPRNAEMKAEMLERTPLQRFNEPEEVANAVLYLLSDKADMIHGATLPVDGGRLCT